jgi:hypothetical protein
MLNVLLLKRNNVLESLDAVNARQQSVSSPRRKNRLRFPSVYVDRVPHPKALAVN